MSKPPEEIIKEVEHLYGIDSSLAAKCRTFFENQAEQKAPEHTDADLIQQCRDFIESAGRTPQPRMFDVARLVVRLADERDGNVSAASGPLLERGWD